MMQSSRYRFIVLGLLFVIGLQGVRQAGANTGESLLDARKDFKTSITKKMKNEGEMPAPPRRLFSLVEYPTELGKMKAYLGTNPQQGKKHPAIIWLTGGFPVGGADEDVWMRPDIHNDQSAQAYRKAGIVMMYPSLRGTYGNPGTHESFYGEVNDVIAALQYLKKVDYVDPNQIYLGGHSTGGTLALLVAEATGEFKAVFAFGPVAEVKDYGRDLLHYDMRNPKENVLRSPKTFLPLIKSQTFVIEGERGNTGDLLAMQKANQNKLVSFLRVEGTDHFSALASSNELIAKKITTTRPNRKLSLSERELKQHFVDFHVAQREANDLSRLSAYRRAGVKFDQDQTFDHYVWAWNESDVKKFEAAAGKAGFRSGGIKSYKDRNGKTYYELAVSKKVKPSDLPGVFAMTGSVATLAKSCRCETDGWDIRR